MLRKLLATAVLVGLVAVAAPQSADASNNAGVVVFTGSAKVGKLSWTDDGGNQAPGNGLCFPGLQAGVGVCALSGSLTDVTNGWSFTVPSAAGGVPGTCTAEGVFNGTPVAGAPSNCTLISNGIVTPNLAGVGPSCGMSHGDTDGAGADPVIAGSSADTVTIVGVAGVGEAHIQWTTSAGGSLPLTGSIEYAGGHSHPITGYVQARPLSGGNCATVPAEDFLTIGVVATR